jgi:hypothetical protein
MQRYQQQTITFQRNQNGRIKKCSITRFCSSPAQAALEIYERAYRRNIKVKFIDLMDQFIKP